MSVSVACRGISRLDGGHQTLHLACPKLRQCHACGVAVTVARGGRHGLGSHTSWPSSGSPPEMSMETHCCCTFVCLFVAARPTIIRPPISCSNAGSCAWLARGCSTSQKKQRPTSLPGEQARRTHCRNEAARNNSPPFVGFSTLPSSISYAHPERRRVRNPSRALATCFASFTTGDAGFVVSIRVIPTPTRRRLSSGVGGALQASERRESRRQRAGPCLHGGLSLSVGPPCDSTITAPPNI